MSQKILFVLLDISETSAPYNEYSRLPEDRFEVSFCAFLPPQVPDARKIFSGDGTLRGFWSALRRAFARRYDVYHAHAPHAGLLLLVGLLLFGRGWRSTVYTVHNSFDNYKLRNKFLLAWNFVFYKRIVHCSRASYDSFPALYKILGKGRLSIIPNGVNLERIDEISPSAEKRGGAEFVILSVGQLIDRKNPLTLLRAVAQLPSPVKLIFLGDGPMRASLQREAADLGLAERVEFAGPVARAEVFDWLRRADLFVSASRGEGLPVAALEAMGCRCPVVLSDIPPHREIGRGVDFIPLVAPEDVAGFARAIASKMDAGGAVRNSVGEQCRDLVEEQFSLKSLIHSYEILYAELTGNAVLS